MKKLLAAVLVLALSLSLVACGGGKDDKKEDVKTENTNKAAETAKTDIKSEASDDAPLTREDTPAQESQPSDSANSEIEWGNIIADPGTFNRNNLTAEQIAAIELDAQQNDYIVDWDKDGNLIITEEGGDMITFGANWPENEYTKQVPKLSEEFVVACDSEEEMFTAVLSWSIDDAKDYAKKLQSKGFNNDPTDMDMGSMYIFTADNGTYSVTITWGAGETSNGGLNICRK